MNRQISMVALAVALIAGGQVKVQAQEAAADTTSEMSDIIVTAQKKSQSLQKVAAAVSVVNSDQIEKLGVNNLSQIPNLTTGLSITPVRTNTFVFLRGVGQTIAAPNVEPAVATNLNGIYVPGNLTGAAFFDVDRVEVVSGPQGTLYGRNAAGGVINIISRMPGAKFAADGFVEIGNYDRRQLVAGVDLPVSDTFAVRIAGTVVRHDGYFHNGLEDERTSAVKGAFVFKPTDATQVSGTLIFTHGGGVGIAAEPQKPFGCGNRCANFDPKALGFFNDADSWQATWQIDQALGDTLNLSYLGGYSTLNSDTSGSALTAPLLPLTLNENTHANSHELRMNGTFGKLDGIVGLYFYHQTGSYYQVVQPPIPVFLFNPFDSKSHGWAAFGQATYSITDFLRLTGGLRYSSTVKSINGFNSANAGNFFDPENALRVGFNPYAGRNTLNRVDYKAGIEFDISPDSVLYGNFATGFNSDGFSSAQSVASPTLVAAAPFKAMTLNAWSAGLKNKLFGGKATLNLEGFYYDYSGYQVASRAATGQLTVFNADKATIYGVQMEGAAHPTRNDDITVGITYLHAVADKLNVNGISYDGLTLPFSPKWSINASYQRSFDVGGGAQLRGLVNFKYVGNQYGLYTHQVGSKIDSHTTTSASFGYFAAQGWSVQAFIRNLEDSIVQTSCGDSIPAGSACLYEPPRTYGATVGFKF